MREAKRHESASQANMDKFYDTNAPGITLNDTDVDENTIKRIYRNPTAIVSTETINKLAAALGVATTDIIEDIPDPEHHC